MKNQIKELRVKIDGLAQVTDSIKTTVVRKLNPDYQGFGEEQGDPYYITEKEDSREIQKTIDSLYLAKAWLGKILGELGTETPYKNDGKRKSVEDIEPIADHSWYKKEGLNHDMNFDLFKEKNHIEKVDWLREEIKISINQVKEQLHFVESERMLLLERVEQYLSEARFWLGFELQRIKDEQ